MAVISLKKEVNLNKIREKMGMVYQGFHLFSHLNVIDNITLAPIQVKKMTKTEAEKKAKELLALVGLSDKEKHFPNQLSGGQQQRIAIARCLAMEPEIMLFDEPTSALDPTMTCEVLSIIRKLTKMGLTMLIVTHEMKFAKDISNRIIYMDEGGVYEEGTPEEIFDHPKKEKTIAFIKKLRILNYQIHSKSFDLVTLNAQIEVFCQKYNLIAKQIYYIQLMIEELITEIFEQCYQNSQPQIEISLEYSDENNDIYLMISYLAQEFNPFISQDEDSESLSMMIVNNISKSSEHHFSNGINTIRLKI